MENRTLVTVKELKIEAPAVTKRQKCYVQNKLMNYLAK